MVSGDQSESVTLQERPAGSEGESDAGSSSSSSSSAESVAESSVAAAATDVASSPDELADVAEPDVAEPDVAESESAEASASDDESSDAETPSSSRSSRGSIRDLEEEGEVAADYLEELLDIVDLDGDIDIDVENGRPSLAIVAEGSNDRSLRRLVGSNGEVLEALQELTRLAVQASTGERSRLMLDVAGHRAQRRKVLTEKASKACEQVKSSGKALSLEAMTAFERKIVHDVVADAGLNSESEGVDPNRHVVILPASA